MSDMYGFGVDEGELSEASAQTEKGPKWYRDGLEKLSGQIAEIKAENDRLKAEQARQAVKDTLTAQGYAPQVADLFQGTPDKLNDWLGTYGAALAKGEGTQEGDPQSQQQGTPPTVVSPESQAAMAAISAASTGGTGPLSGEDQMAARLNAAQTQEEFNAIMREAGNVRFQ